MSITLHPCIEARKHQLLAEMNIFTCGGDIFLFAEMKDFIRGAGMPIHGDEVHCLQQREKKSLHKRELNTKINTD